MLANLFRAKEEAASHRAFWTPLQPRSPISSERVVLYGLYRDYIKHEDGLMQTRLGAFLTLNSFLLAGSMLILGAMIQAFANPDLPREKTLLIMFFAAVFHSFIALLGGKSAVATSRSLRSASDALRMLEAMGNGLFAGEIIGGTVPAFTNARLLDSSERLGNDRGSEIMRDIPRMMRWLWLLICLLPWGFIAIIMAAYPGTLSPVPDSPTPVRVSVTMQPGPTLAPAAVRSPQAAASPAPGSPSP